MRLPNNYQAACAKVRELESKYAALSEQCYQIALILGDDPALLPVKNLRDNARQEWEIACGILERLRP